MIVEIKNLGFVKNVKVNLGKDLIILCGPNNTGKTYVAYALYGFLKHRSVQSQITRINTTVQKLPETGEIEIDLINILETRGSHHLTSVARDYQKHLPRVFASGDGTFSKTIIEAELGDLTSLKDKILETNIAVSVGFVSGISAKIVKEKGESVLKC